MLLIYPEEDSRYFAIISIKECALLKRLTYMQMNRAQTF